MELANAISQAKAAFENDVNTKATVRMKEKVKYYVSQII